jgi:hypothetical protein
VRRDECVKDTAICPGRQILISSVEQSATAHSSSRSLFQAGRCVDSTAIRPARQILISSVEQSAAAHSSSRSVFEANTSNTQQSALAGSS